jgi:hypothetical protein
MSLGQNKYVTEEIDYLNNGMYELNVNGNSQSGVVCNSGIGVREVTGIDQSSSNILQLHNSENMKKQICCINMGTGMKGTALCGCLNGVWWVWSRDFTCTFSWSCMLF